MDFEALVMYYLSSQGLFVSPQFSVRDGNGEWSCPDLVALDFRNHQVQVVEVTTAYDVSNLANKIQNRQEQWIRRLVPQLISQGVPVQTWSVVVRAFVRRDRIEFMKSRFVGSEDVMVEVLEDIAFSWTWPWDQWKAPFAPEGHTPG